MFMPPHTQIERAVALALAEDVGDGDITSVSTVPASTLGKAVFTVKASGVLAGGAVMEAVYRQVDPAVRFKIWIADGKEVHPGDHIAGVEGPARSILTGERVALNFAQYLSGIATRTRQFARLVDGTGARVIDTRKTVPGMRALAKYAVRVGGGHNHRYALYDGVLIKDNHIRAAHGITAAVHAARQNAHHLLKIEVETDNLDQVREALEAKADIILLDNMDLPTLARAVALCKGRAVTEASGRVSEATVRSIAETGVDLISVGALTHSVTALDISLDWESG